MFTFLFYSGTDLNEVEDTLRKSAIATRRIIPKPPSGSGFHIRMIPELNAGWYILHPQLQESRPYVSEYVDESLAVLAFGISIDGSDQEMASIVADAWKKGGVMHVRRLDNSFSVVLVDRQAKKLYIISDQLGLRSLHYFIQQKQLWISPHDVPIVTGSKCRLQVNSLSVYSIFRTGWSLKGVPLLSDLHVIDPKYYYLWSDGELSKTEDHILTGVERLEPNDVAGKSRNLEELITHLNTLMATIIEDHHVIDVDMTAGWDTRTIAALLLHNAGQRKIRTFTSGKTSDTECRTAQWFARQYHIEHYCNTPISCSPDWIRERVAAHAFYTNGQGSSWREFHKGSITRDKSVPHFTGQNPGSIKGLYYPDKFVTSPKAGNAINVVQVLVPGTIRIPIEFFSQELEDGLEGQILEIIQDFTRISSLPHDILDLFSIYERIGRYATADCELKFPNVTNRYCLFESPTLARLACQMFAPMSQAFALQRRIIKRYAPRSYYKLFNERIFAPTMSNRYLGRFSKMVFEAKLKLTSLIPIGTLTLHEKHIQEQIHKDLITYAQDSMADKQGLLSSAFDKTQLSSLIKYQPELSAKQKSLLGHVVGLETWYKQVREARTFKKG